MHESLNFSEFEKLRIIYNEIISGCSFSDDLKLYIKHLTEKENVDILLKRHELLLQYNKQGVPTREEKIEDLIKEERWSKESDEQIEQLKVIISDNEKNLKFIIPPQKPAIERIILEKKTELSKLLQEKEELIGHTANEFAERETHNYLIHLSFYKDRELKHKKFEKFEDLEDMEYEELAVYITALEQALSKFQEETVRKIAVLPMFMNVFSYAKENVYTFLAKPLCYLTAFQVLLMSLGSRNLNVLSQAEGEPPEIVGDTKLIDVVNWYDLTYSVILGKRGNQSTGITKSIKEVLK